MANPRHNASPRATDPRAMVYRLIAGLLAEPPSREVLQALAEIDVRPAPEGTRANPDMAAAWQALQRAAEETDPAEVEDEFHQLFVGISLGELMPYASWYVNRSVMSGPLALLRRDLDALGIERNPDVREPEDHASAVCEAMSLLIEGADEFPSEAQRRFFDDHIAHWLPSFFADLQRARAAHFYVTVGALGERFMSIEERYFALPE